MAGGKVVLCFDDIDFKRCVTADHPLSESREDFEIISDSNFDHKRVKIAASEGTVAKVYLLITFLESVFVSGSFSSGYPKQLSHTDIQVL